MKLASAPGRWIVAGAVLGSGAVFLEGSVVSVGYHPSRAICTLASPVCSG